MTCEKDTKIVVANFEGTEIVQVILCKACQLKKALPQSTEEKLRTIQRAEEIPSIGDWTIAQKAVAKKLGMSGKALSDVKCSNCGTLSDVRNDKTRGPLCEVCYKEYRKTYMKDLMRRVRGK